MTYGNTCAKVASADIAWSWVFQSVGIEKRSQIRDVREVWSGETVSSSPANADLDICLSIEMSIHHGTLDEQKLWRNVHWKVLPEY